jgi:Mrp family chromosome partitioning ATPase
VILVVDSGRTRAEALVRAKEHLARSSTRILGAVLNKLTTRVTDYDDRRRSGYYPPAPYAAKEPRIDPMPGGS